MKEAVIVSAARTAVGKAKKGALAHVRPDDFGAVAIRAAVERASPLDPAAIDDVIFGCAMPEAEQGMNVARIAALRAGLPVSVSAVTVNRFCASGLQTIAFAADRIRAGGAEVIVAGGTESMSLIPMTGNKLSPNPTLVDTYPDVYLSMGLTAEMVARKYDISREDADAFSYRSHQRALAAQQAGRFQPEIAPVTVIRKDRDARGKTITTEQVFDVDEGPRSDTTLEALARLKPAFHVAGQVTAGNASQTSDGAAAVVVMSETRARELGLPPLARFVAFATGGVAPEIMGIGPVEAVPKALKQAGLSLDAIKLIELNEAFAAQSLAVMKVLELDPERVNINGGAIALGHPLGCTGAKLTASLIYELRRQGGGYGMVTMCIGGGMGAAGIFEVFPEAA
ncbi:acetyl-CoA C-acyltransferase [Chloracidobacterium aggregatum]|jgi:acetyl-CoA acyltransferase|uniref:acetyl-CoA C-acyltransferase n=1 Tax=Chloracidobacterium sp. N TaxID=2821540 RepID=A0ABX8AWU8_9BACT|nr:acetyl-CoA C-acyltransferase [Chloracidobacterium aggregatum]QUV87037.1 acetyl-CoA C-acyltransferase [Chloracidobacterium sp. S]QUV89947.1 acetyl-CoA C-acyltransferase [Chloracidobacterium sp. A]QUV93158.1 acetyl-CoA C-acyltransferase [Chloracidobacterium sp. N]QUV96313.1 acetyl-CoA C-acyltransferase [Chloracidobacterium sp. E]